MSSLGLLNSVFLLEAALATDLPHPPPNPDWIYEIAADHYGEGDRILGSYLCIYNVEIGRLLAGDSCKTPPDPGTELLLPPSWVLRCRLQASLGRPCATLSEKEKQEPLYQTLPPIGQQCVTAIRTKYPELDLAYVVILAKSMNIEKKGGMSDKDQLRVCSTTPLTEWKQHMLPIPMTSVILGENGAPDIYVSHL